MKEKGSYLKEILRGSRWAFLFAGCFSFVSNLLMLVIPIYMIQVFDRVLSSRSLETLFYLTAMAIAALLFFGLLYFLRSWLLLIVSNWLDEQLSTHALTQSFEIYLLGNRYGVQSLKDINQLKTFLCGQGILSFFDAPWTPIFIFVIFLLHSYLGILATLGAIILFILALLNESITRTPLDKANTQALLLYKKIDAALRNADVVQAMGMLPGIIGKWKIENAEIIENQSQASQRAGFLLSIVKFTRMSLQLGIMCLGAYLVLSAELTPGGMIAGSILMGRALAPVEEAIGTWKQWILTRQAYKRLNQLLELPEIRPGVFQLPRPKGLLEAEGVSFAYPNKNKYALFQINFRVEPAESLAIIGPTAAGKSTLCKLIVGGMRPSAGSIRLDGADVFMNKQEVMGRYIGYLPQDIELFSGSVKENIARMGDIDEGEVLKAAQLAQVHELILHLPQGYETEIGEAGDELSGGQRQRIGLARALYKRPSLIVLDEPNSNLDLEGENALMQALQKAKSWGATTIIIAQKPSILKNVDKVLLLKEGRIAAFGPREEIFQQVQQK